MLFSGFSDSVQIVAALSPQPLSPYFFPSSKNITPIPISNYPKKSYHPIKRETYLILFSNYLETMAN
jgi:hypothetical protein